MKQWSEREERDSTLVVKAVVESASGFLTAYQTWLYEEVKELKQRCTDCVAKYDDPLRSKIKPHITRLNDIDTYEIDEAVNELRVKIGDVNVGSYDNIVDARRHVDEGIYRFESLVRECLELRRLLDLLEL
jgi:hypothetical protein